MELVHFDAKLEDKYVGSFTK